jgi:hypothetical protein
MTQAVETSAIMCADGLSGTYGALAKAGGRTGASGG